MKKSGEILKQAREKAGLSQGELAKELGYSSPQLISNVERGLCSVPLKKARDFCRLTGMAQKDLRNILIGVATRRINNYLPAPSKRDK